MLLYIPLRIVSFRVKVLVVQIMFLSNGIFRSQSRGRLNRLGFAMNVITLFLVRLYNCRLQFCHLRSLLQLNNQTPDDTQTKENTRKYIFSSRRPSPGLPSQLVKVARVTSRRQETSQTPNELIRPADLRL